VSNTKRVIDKIASEIPSGVKKIPENVKSDVMQDQSGLIGKILLIIV
jgi:hypothetical protein